QIASVFLSHVRKAHIPLLKETKICLRCDCGYKSNYNADHECDLLNFTMVVEDRSEKEKETLKARVEGITSSIKKSIMQCPL
ncbi:hypothetical protein PFISCL1PPCAC_25995, partial [Pristionchus fissidentatus]